MAPPPCTASSHPPHNHHVFISFCEQDTGRSFTSHLHNALTRNGLITYLGNDNSDCAQAIHYAKLSLIVFSKNYATSVSCLDQLAKIVKCSKENSQVVVPVFYDVNPRIVGRQKRSYAEAFAMHEQNFESNYMEKVQLWRNALTKASAFSGCAIDNLRMEHELVEGLAKYVWEKLNVADLDMRIEQLKQLAKIQQEFSQAASYIEDNYESHKFTLNHVHQLQAEKKLRELRLTPHLLSHMAITDVNGSQRQPFIRRSARWRGLETNNDNRSTRKRKKPGSFEGDIMVSGHEGKVDASSYQVPEALHERVHVCSDDGRSRHIPTVNESDVPQASHYREIEFIIPDESNQGQELDESASDEDQGVDKSGSPLKLIEHDANKNFSDAASLEYKDEGDAVYTCKFCGAKFWFNERVKRDRQLTSINSVSLCCLKGKVVLPPLKTPPPLFQSLFLSKSTPLSRKFHANIRHYNNMFSFTSMGGKVDHLKNRGGGPYTFVLSGMNYHNIGSLLPPKGSKPIYSQLYICDPENEVSNRISVVSKHQNDNSIYPTLVDMIKYELDEVNPFVQTYRQAAAVMKNKDRPALKMCLIGTRQHDGRSHNLPSASEVAALIVGDIDRTFNVRDIIVEEHSGVPQRINELHVSYLPLQYPLLFPYGEDGYRDDVHHREETLIDTITKKRVTIREFFSYRLMVRDQELSVIIHASRLLQQFIVDGFAMMESQRLLWVRTHQKDIRADLYQGLSDAVIRGERKASCTGKRIILPSSFIGSARYMIQCYQDVMAICRTIGYPDLFITFTCNPTWPEIKRHCDQLDLKPSDCPQVLARIFQMKLRSLMKTLKKDKIFGTVIADVYTIEFQKKGLPHAHILLFLDHNDKMNDLASIDKVISAEIPDKYSEPLLYELVKKYMIHGPCGSNRLSASCMKNKECTKYFPKKFNDETSFDNNGYPTYRRRDHGHTVELKGVHLDNRYVVSYNPMLLQMFQAHINIEKCNQSIAIKYIFKQISKGDDRVVLGLFERDLYSNDKGVIDEILQYCNCRYVSSCEAAWRILGFDIHHRSPSVERLSFHLPNKQFVLYFNDCDIAELLDKPRVCESQFLAWFQINDVDEFAATLTYSEFPNHYVYEKSKRQWKKRQRGFSIGRISHVLPSAGELYYLRILLTKVRGPTSFEDIRTVDGVIHQTFKEACFVRGLLDDDNEYIGAIKEASMWASGRSLRMLFVTMLLCSSLQRPDYVWKETYKKISEDLLCIPRNDSTLSGVQRSWIDTEYDALREIDVLLKKNGKSLHDFPPLSLPRNIPLVDVNNHLIMQELNYDRQSLKTKADNLVASLNSDQEFVYQRVMASLDLPHGGFFFVYGSGGTGKTFLWNALTYTLRSKGEIVITVASSGIAATLLPFGQTAHSRFAIPTQITECSMCSINQNSALANLLKAVRLIIWDEAPMVHRLCIEAFDRSLRDIMHSNLPFGGKCVLMGGDFRQILPVIPKGTRASIVNACINSSHLWDHCVIFHLRENMRLNACATNKDKKKLEWFSKWLLDVGDGNIGKSIDGVAEIDIPKDFLIPSFDDPTTAIISATYIDLNNNLSCNEYFNDRAILAPTVEIVNQINDHMCAKFLGEEVEFLSYDSVCRATFDSGNLENLYTSEFLNTITCSGLPSHRLLLKVGVPIMLLRNINQASGLCNGTRLRISKLGKNVIEAITLNGSRPNEKVLIHRMDTSHTDSRWPFHMQRRQFPITLSFAMTINKSQGQSLRHVGLYLSKPVFTHGQLYVALSRVRSMDGLKIVVHDTRKMGKNTTKNVVYKEIFRNVAMG